MLLLLSRCLLLSRYLLLSTSPVVEISAATKTQNLDCSSGICLATLDSTTQIIFQLYSCVLSGLRLRLVGSGYSYELLRIIAFYRLLLDVLCVIR